MDVEIFTRIISAVIIIGLIIYIVPKLVLKFWPETGKIGINHRVVSCPICNEPQPKTRVPKNRTQMLWGGWTCFKCGTEMDKYGDETNS